MHENVLGASNFEVQQGVFVGAVVRSNELEGSSSKHPLARHFVTCWSSILCIMPIVYKGDSTKS